MIFRQVIMNGDIPSSEKGIVIFRREIMNGDIPLSEKEL